MAIDNFMSDQSEERLQAWLEKKAVVDSADQVVNSAVFTQHS